MIVIRYDNMIIRGKIGSILRNVYIYWWLHCINRGKLKNNLLTRKDRGYPLCIECGLCCASVCSCFDFDTGLCKIWDDTIATKCRSFPVAPCQAGGYNRKVKPFHVCRYYWGEEERTPTREEVKERISKKLEEVKKKRGLM